ncbi:hypothetical protein COCCADRAFT_112120 [Bipolaris zeicola 26-R-13]|uniref:Uncharacterized protein n=1 Tax=Cochliobolus carbonum (strain 26-R-13) TaxID=930089 RepID=W6XP61_COCC2|nr:uncharacterized protein COCCADRAFT_112120 [Bipolaris zeicola 26-R-13]EUC27283.1 hypothetical protein COCCADRAFT_112120 [Bipolaris zeicola 26-R-13]
MPLSDTTADTDPSSLACAVTLRLDVKESKLVDVGALVGSERLAWVSDSLVNHVSRNIYYTLNHVMLHHNI